MRTILWLIPFFFSFLDAFSQSKRIDSMLKLPEVKQGYYQMEVSGSKVMYLQMEYGKSDFTISQNEGLGRGRIRQIIGNRLDAKRLARVSPR